ncbi:ABC transporter permease subunit [uncultured Piscinibacter sp.]|uniref:ABC transporter permease subunit n=1 Tax=uncultured Piscinibacter sp. TaxID=1131835 RepID=UPI002617A6EC|nr:ABC transporter permease subunit [uncultured Piscinibacter sp.]
MKSAARGWWWPAGLFALPLVISLGLALQGAADAAGWAQLFDDPALPPALALSVWVGAVATAASLALTLALVTHLHGSAAWARIERALGALLAVPHAAFAVGLALLLVPSGLLMRVVAPLAGWDSPPDLATVHDPFGLALILGLVLKEVPFLLWNVAAQLRPVAQAMQLRQQLQAGQAMGYASPSVWWRVLWPQLLPRLALPLLAVWAYGASVVDMALVLGPTRPPTLAQLAWQWLLDADAATNAKGAAAALLIALVVAAGALLAVAAARTLRPWLRARQLRGDRPVHAPLAGLMRPLAGSGAVLYVGVLALLAFVSVASVWSFPSLVPQTVSSDAWAMVFRSLPTLGNTALIGIAASFTGLALAIAWMETAPAGWDRRAAPLVFATMLVPGVLLVSGLYQLMLGLRLDGRLAGLWIAHSLFCAPYALVALAPAYRGFDARYELTARALGRSRAALLWRIKWPMLLAPMASAAAVGFAVSVAQYLSTQFVGAGRHATVTTEALTLASGGQRTLLAAYALLQALLPALAFGAAWWVARRQARRLGTEAP